MKHHKRGQNRYVRWAAAVFVVLAVGSVGWYLQRASAATYAVETGVATGQVRGNAKVIDSLSASSGHAVRFGTPGNCSMATRQPLRDQADQPYVYSYGWPIDAAGEKIIVYFQTDGLDAEYASHVQYAASEWNKSACIDARVVVKCPVSGYVNCVTFTMRTNQPDTRYADASAWFATVGKYRLRGNINFYPSMDPLPVAQRRQVVTHEMGHEFGLLHRQTPNLVMSTYSSTSTSARIDSTDLHNLLVIYGSPDAAMQQYDDESGEKEFQITIVD